MRCLRSAHRPELRAESAECRVHSAEERRCCFERCFIVEQCANEWLGYIGILRRDESFIESLRQLNFCRSFWSLFAPRPKTLFGPLPLGRLMLGSGSSCRGGRKKEKEKDKEKESKKSEPPLPVCVSISARGRGLCGARKR